MVDNAGDASDDLPVLVGEKIFCLAELKGCVAVFPKGVQLIGIQIGRIIRVTLVQIVVQLDEGIKLFSGGNFANLY